MDESRVCETIFISFGFDQEKDFFVIFMKNIVINICFVIVSWFDDPTNVACPLNLLPLLA
jgi:hypothetical protein